MISTLKALFQGKRELFRGLKIDEYDSPIAGRPDSVVKTEKAIYIVEFKYAQSAEAALAQSREKRYADAYSSDGRRVVYVGVNYDPASRTVDAVRTEVAIGCETQDFRQSLGVTPVEALKALRNVSGLV